MNKRGQAAMEFLMTYGWAIIIVLAAIGALAYFGVFNPRNLVPDKTLFSGEVPNADKALIKASDNSVEIAFKNNKGVPITLTGVTTLTPDTGTTCASPVLTRGGAAINPATQIANGETFLLKWDCTDLAQPPAANARFKATINFEYNNTETSQVFTQSGTVEGKYT